MVEKNRYSIGGLCQRGKNQGPKVLIPVLTLVLLLLVSQAAARLSWSLLDLTSPPHVDVVTGPRAGGPAVSSADPSSVNTGLVDLHLFGRAGRVSVAPLTDASDLPPTTLDLTLVGVIFSTSPGKSVAIIATKGETTENEIYGVGDKLPGAAVLSEIHPDQVILRRGGRYETLAIDESVSSSISSPPPQKAAPSRKGLRKKERHRQIRSRGDGVNWSIDRGYLDQRLADMNSLASEVGADIYQEDGVQQGFQLRANNKSRLLDELGLQSGDVLTEVNGMPLRSASDAMQAFAKTKKAEKVRVEIIRDGTRQTREYAISQL